MTISYGSTVSYGQHAQRVGRSKAARAVGAAIGRNPVSIVVPCHRVLGANGDVTGYAGGLERKRALLAFEARQQLPLALGEENQLTRRSANG
jgi:methylated-DNA-[protein]-cysteine S-methyltransferase